MGVVLKAKYIGGKKLALTHVDSGATFVTDAPKDNNGEGSSFSPTDLVAAALPSCMMTVIAIVAERDNLSLEGMHMQVEKKMHTAPRRIASIEGSIHLPVHLTAEARLKLERAAKTCPVYATLHPDVSVQIEFLYDVT